VGLSPTRKQKILCAFFGKTRYRIANGWNNGGHACTTKSNRHRRTYVGRSSQMQVKSPAQFQLPEGRWANAGLRNGCEVCPCWLVGLDWHADGRRVSTQPLVGPGEVWGTDLNTDGKATQGGSELERTRQGRSERPGGCSNESRAGKFSRFLSSSYRNPPKGSAFLRI